MAYEPNRWNKVFGVMGALSPFAAILVYLLYRIAYYA